MVIAPLTFQQEKIIFAVAAVVILVVFTFRLDQLFRMPKPGQKRPESSPRRVYVVEEAEDDSQKP